MPGGTVCIFMCRRRDEGDTDSKGVVGCRRFALLEGAHQAVSRTSGDKNSGHRGKSDLERISVCHAGQGMNGVGIGADL